MTRHLPRLWRWRVLRRLRAPVRRSTLRLLRAWARAEGGTAAFNPLNTTQPWKGATDYNSAGVKNYPSGRAGVEATVATLTNGYYNGIVHDLRWPRRLTARSIVERNAHEFDTWGTGAGHILGVLSSTR